MNKRFCIIVAYKEGRHAMSEKKNAAKKAAASIAAVTAAGMLLSGVMSAPGDLSKVCDLPPAQQAYVEVLADDMPDDDEEEEELAVTNEKKSFGSRVKERFFALPAPARALLALLLWLPGRLLVAVVVSLARGAFTPLGCIVLKYIGIAALSLLAILAAVKAVNPDIPLGRVINKRSILLAMSAAAVFGLAGTLMERFCPEKLRIYTLTESALILVSILIIAFRLTMILKRKHSKQNAAV